MDMNEKVKILVVDDLSEKLLVYRTVLEDLNEELYTAMSGEEALRLVLKHDFAVILLDVNMPGMDGLETASLIRKRFKTRYTPIIFVTAFLDEFRSQQGYAHGAVDYILAPIDPVILRAKVKVFVDLFRMQREVERRAAEKVLLAEEHAKRLFAEEAHRMSSFLDQASKVLSQTLELPEIMNQLAGLNVPKFAEACIVSVQPSTDVDIIHRGVWKNEGMEVSEEALCNQLLPEIMQSITTGNPITVEKPTELNWTSIAEFPIAEVLVQPLKARGRTLGTMSYLNTAASLVERNKNRTLIDELSSRAAVAIDNVLLLQHIRETDRRKDEFLAILAHELRNPLAPLRNALSILQMKEKENVAVQNAGAMIGRQLTQMTRLVDDLLDVSRITSGKINLNFETVDLHTTVMTAVEATRHHFDSRQQKLGVRFPPQQLCLKADPVRMTQIIANLLNNASKYTNPEGAITLTIRQQNQLISISVKDNGEGIPSHMQRRIFDLFTQVDESVEKSHGGLGIGLTLVKRFVEMHEGDIEVFSEGHEKGSEFIVSFPYDASLQVPHTPAPELAHDIPMPRKSVLVVDDNVDSADSMAMLLELMKIEVFTANNGIDALDQAEKLRPSMILLDIGMPGMNGYEVAKSIREKAWGQKTKIIALTGWGQEQDRVQSKTAGIDVHLVKPINIDQVRELITS